MRRFALLAVLALTSGVASAGAIATCGNQVIDPGEECDDGNPVEGDGCTTLCRAGASCQAADRPGAEALSVDPGNGHCYARYTAAETFDGASTACASGQGHLVTITSSAEQQGAAALGAVGGVYWIGAVDDANDTDSVFAWVTNEPWSYTSFAPNEPDDDLALGGTGECLAITGTGWVDTNCDFDAFVSGRICEYQANIFADGFE